jgi:hypothetical protein
MLACLQNLRDEIGERRNGTGVDPDGAEVEEILWILRGLAIAARTTGFNAYGCICLHLAEQVEDAHCEGRWSVQTLTRLWVWVEYSDSYLRHPSEAAVVMTLIAQLNCEEWGSPLCQLEEDTLYRALLNPFTPYPKAYSPR